MSDWGELRSLLAVRQWVSSSYMAAMDLILASTGSSRVAMVHYCKQARPDLQWDIIEWSLQCEQAARRRCWDLDYYVRHREPGIRALLKGIAWLGLHGADMTRCTLAARVGEGDHWLAVCLMDDDRCNAVLLGLYNTKPLGRACVTFCGKVERDHAPTRDVVLAVKVPDPDCEYPDEWPIVIADLEVVG